MSGYSVTFPIPNPLYWTLGRNRQESFAVALSLRWAGHGAPRRRPRTHLSRPFLETTPSRFTEHARNHYAHHSAMPGSMHSGFMQFAAFNQDAVDNKAFLAKRKTRHAGARSGRREILWQDDGRGHALCCHRRPGGRDSG